MAVPAALVVIGVGLLVVPWRRFAPPEPPTPIESGKGTYSITLISTEIEQWQTFFAAATTKRWIRFLDDMPTADGLIGDDGSPRFVLPESLKLNLTVVYRYLTALIEAHDRIKRWQGSVEPIASDKKSSEDSGIREIVAEAAASVISGIGVFGIRYGWFSHKLQRAQLKDKEYQECLQALPGILSSLLDDLEAVRTGGPIGGKIQAPIKLPMVPAIETSNHGSIDFELVPVKSYG
jgi:hypothetical protein